MWKGMTDPALPRMVGGFGRLLRRMDLQFTAAGAAIGYGGGAVSVHPAHAVGAGFLGGGIALGSALAIRGIVWVVENG